MNCFHLIKNALRGNDESHGNKINHELIRNIKCVARKHHFTRTEINSGKIEREKITNVIFVS